MQRMGSMLKLKDGAYEEYRTAHAAVWPQVLAAITKANIRNYSIYHKDGFLFSYLEYYGSDYEKDMARMAAEPIVQKWWGVMMRLQEPLPTRNPGEWWAAMEELFHLD